MCFRYPFSAFKCGKCPECLQSLRRDWSIRLQLHAQFSGKRPFIAHLTYDNEHLPVENGVSTLRKKDLQLFLKRLRHYVPKGLQYYASGEYGTNSTHRPHYHIILFGLDESKEADETISLLQKAWQNGFVRHTSMWVRDYAQLHYVTKYIINFFEYNYNDRLPPFRLCSSKFGEDFIKYALEKNLYHREIQQLFKPILKERLIPCSTSSTGKRKIVYPVGFVGEQVYWHETNHHETIFNPLLENFRDFIEFKETIKGKDHVYRFPLPRYFANRLYTEDFRYTLAYYKEKKMSLQAIKYASEFSEYDKIAEIPMWREQKLYRWNHKKKNYKDSMNFKNPTQFLND